ncbi:MAG: hypothetical protein V3U15_05095 [Nitrospinota bacterium]
MTSLSFTDKVPDDKNCCYDTDTPKQYADGVHDLTSLSIINMNINNIIHEYIPPVNIQSGKGLVETNLPNTVVTNIAVSMLINIFAQFSRCLLSKFMNKKYYKILTNTTIL